MVATTTSTVSTARLRALLTSSRASRNLTVEELSRRSNFVFSARQLNEIERGTLFVDDATMATLLDLYQVERPLDTPGRGELVIDLVEDRIRIDDISLPLESSEADDVLERYVSLVHLVRSTEMPAGTVLGLRDDDLDTLAVTLDAPSYEIRQRIRQRGRKTRRTATVLRVLGPVLALTLMLAVLAGAFFLTSDPQNALTASSPNLAAVAAAQPLSEPAVPVRGEAGATQSEAIAPAASAVGSAAAQPVLSARAQAIEDAIDWNFRAALPTWSVEHGDAHPTWRGVTNTVERTVTLFDRPETSIEEAASVLAHELGHAVDIDVLDDNSRRAWLALRGIDTGWWAGEAQADFDVGAGDFAEAVATYLVDSPTRSPHGAYTAEQLAFVTDLIPGR